MTDTDDASELAEAKHFSCYDSEWAALEKERATLGLYTRFDVIRYYFRRRGRKGFAKPRKAKPGQKLAVGAR